MFMKIFELEAKAASKIKSSLFKKIDNLIKHAAMESVRLEHDAVENASVIFSQPTIAEEIRQKEILNDKISLLDCNFDGAAVYVARDLAKEVVEHLVDVHEMSQFSFDWSKEDE